MAIVINLDMNSDDVELDCGFDHAHDGEGD